MSNSEKSKENVQFLPSPIQEKVITSDYHLVITANAGSGKTQTMVQKIVRLIKSGVPVEKIAALTFTEKAANEISLRVFQALDDSEVSDEITDNIFKANFSTIHSFCNKLLKEFPVEAGLNPNFSLMTDLELHEYKLRAIHIFLEKKYKAKDKSLKIFIQKYGLEFFKEQITQIYYKRSKLNNFEIEFQEKHKLFLEKFYNDLSKFYDEVVFILNNFSSEKTQNKDIMKENEQRDTKLAFITNAMNNSELLIALKEIFEKRTSLGKYLAKEFSTESDQLEMYDFIRENKFDILKSIEDFNQELLLLYDWGNEIIENMEKLSIDNNILHHDESLILTARMLETHSDTILPKLQTRFHTIMVDEFQDTDELQYRIIKSFINDLTPSISIDSISTKLVIVGDAKQSIYAFRGAEVGVFIEAKNELLALNSTNLTKAEEVVLADTYRLFPTLINFNNAVFKNIFELPFKTNLLEANKVAKIDYEKFNLAEGAKTNNEFSKVNIININKNEKDLKKHLFEREAQYTANLIANMLYKPYMIYDKKLKSKRQVKASDIAVISRNATNFSILKFYLEDLKIPVKYQGEKQWFENNIYLDLANYLKFLIFPQDDIALMTILKSPFFGLSDSELLEMKLLYKAEFTDNNNPHLFDIIKTKNKPISMILENQINIAQRINITFLISDIIKRSNWFVNVSLSDTQRQNSLKAIFNYSRGFEENGFGNLYDFVMKLEDLSQNKINEEINYTSDFNAIELLTIHKSKGLEFPIVIIYNLAGGGNNRYDNSKGLNYNFISFDNELDNKLIETKDNYITKYLKEYKLLTEHEENKRLLYVAFTRAEQQLFINTIDSSNKNDSSLKLLQDYVVTAMKDIAKLNWDLFDETNPILSFSKDNIDLNVELVTTEKELLTGQLTDYQKHLFFSASKIKKFKDEKFDYSDIYFFGNKSEKAIINSKNSNENEAEQSLPITISNQDKAIIIGNAFHYIMENINKWYVNDNFEMLKLSLDNFLSENHIINDLEIKEKVFAFALELINTNIFKEYLKEILNGKKEFCLYMPFNDDFFMVTIDLLIKHDNGDYEIWDWKTNQITTSSDIERLANTYKYQMQTYSYFAMLLNEQQEIFKARLVFPNALDSKIFEKCFYEFIFTRDELMNFSNQITNDVIEIKDYEKNIYDNYSIA